MAASDWPDFGFHHHSVPEPPLFQAGLPMDAESLAGWMPEIVGICRIVCSRIVRCGILYLSQIPIAALRNSQ